VFSLEHCASERSSATNFQLFPVRRDWNGLRTKKCGVLLSEDTFNAIPISTAFILKSESCSLECSLEVFRGVDEKYDVVDIAFLTEFLQEAFSQCGCRDRNTLRESKQYFQQEEYQTEGDHGPSQTAQWAREKLAKRKDHFLHALSKDIVEQCVDHDVGTLVVGDPSGVDEDDWGRHGNKRLDNWAYKRLLHLIDYKARERGIEVEMPDERGTSSTCSVCGHEGDDSRVERGLWKCDRCGVVAHSDVNGADNIRQETLPVTPPLGDSGNGCLAQPRVIHFSRTHGFQPRATAE
jgi:putative transposase